MKRKIILKHLIAIALAVCFLATYIFPADLPLTCVADTQDELDKVNDELEKLKESQGKLDEEFSNLNSELNTAGQKISELELKINEKNADIEDLNLKIKAMEEEVSEQYEDMKLRIQFMYENSSKGFLDLLLSADSFSDLLSRSVYINKISEYDRTKMDELSLLLAEEQEARDTLVLEYQELVTLKNDVEKEYSNISNLMAQLQSKIDANSDNIKQAEALALEYEKKIQQELLNKQLAEIAAGNGGSVDADSLAHVLANYTEHELAMLAAIIECEAGNQPYEGMLAVGSVVINRVANPRFADTIEGVLYAPYQFSPVGSGRFAIVLARGATDICTQAALEVLSGNITIDAHYFHMYNPAVDFGGTVIGDHVFY